MNSALNLNTVKVKYYTTNIKEPDEIVYVTKHTSGIPNSVWRFHHHRH